MSAKVETEYTSLEVVEIDVGRDWFISEEKEKGACAKETLIYASKDAKYIFKIPNEGKEHQIWSEMLGSFIAGDLLGWKVQRVGLGVMKRRYGNMIEYMYNSKTHILNEGVRHCKHVDPHYDEKEGKRHTLKLLQDVCVFLNINYDLGVEKFWDYWGQAFALDTLISNMDRHAENWAIVHDRESGMASHMSPLYDNGTSLGCRVETKGLDKKFNTRNEIHSDHLKKLKDHGGHHVRIGKDHARFEEVNAQYLDIYPDGRKWFEQAAKVDIEKVLDQMQIIESWCKEVGLREPYALTERRQRYIHAVLQIGMDRVKKAL